MMGHLPADVIYKIIRGNAIRMLSLDIVLSAVARPGRLAG